MRKYLWVICLFVCCLMVRPAAAFMPTYNDDAEFDICTRMNTWNDCVVEESQRFLRVVRQQYRTILSTPSILQWHASPEENNTVLLDMYESWTAFRNRLCSLSNKAAKYMEPLVEEKNACNLYYILHHHDHLNSILLLMTRKAPARKSDFKFLKIIDHDEEYEKCITAKIGGCIDAELKRSSKAIKDYYKTFSEDEFVGKWNNGPDLSQGNYRDMYDSWVAYRNRMCSLAVWAYKSFYGPKSMNMVNCLQFYNREKLETMQNLLVTAHSALDDAHEVDDDLGNQNPTFSTDYDDGGAAEGRTITPLERHISSGSSKPDMLVVPDEKKAEPRPQQPKEDDNRDIPAWAQ